MKDSTRWEIPSTRSRFLQVLFWLRVHPSYTIAEFPDPQQGVRERNFKGQTMKYSFVFCATLLVLGCSPKPPATTSSPAPISPTASANPVESVTPSPQVLEFRPRPNLPEEFFASLAPLRQFTEDQALAEDWFNRGMSETYLALYTSNQTAEETCKALLPSLQADGRVNYWKGEDWHNVDGSWVGAYAKPEDIWGALVVVTPFPEAGQEFTSPLYQNLKLPSPGKLPEGSGCVVLATTAYELPPLFREAWPQP